MTAGGCMATAKTKSSTVKTTKATVKRTKTDETSAKKTAAKKVTAKKAVSAKTGKTVAAKPTTTRSRTTTKEKTKPVVAKTAKSAPKTTVKADSKAKLLTKAKAQAKSTLPLNQYTEQQKLELLEWVGKIDMLHKHDQSGLKGLAKIDEILDKHNQRFKEMNAKFEAIVKFGIEKDPRIEHDHFYLTMGNRDKDINDLFELLAKIGLGEVKYDEAKQRVMSIYKDASALLQHKR